MFMLISFYDIILFLIITFILVFSTSEKFEIIFRKMVDIIIFLWYNTFVAVGKAVFRGMGTAGENSGKGVP